MTWFQRLTGIEEQSPDQVRSQLSIDGDQIVCPDGARIAFGQLEIEKLGALRSRVEAIPSPAGRLRLHEIVGDVRQLHADAANAGAMFQVASQFNLLEMADPATTPEQGVGIYEHDHTQGPVLRDCLRWWHDLSQLLCAAWHAGWSVG